ncbi:MULTISPECIES: hypothetical protein [Xanthomonas]|nr:MULTISPECIES: hypothetical protein [Xanthomonas]QXF03595.1 hypothetical protein KJA71_09125 [Xanthomonas citri pv. citri]QXO96850.1 hypothetical protein IG630_24175 [Xanthomonas sp. WG16]
MYGSSLDGMFIGFAIMCALVGATIFALLFWLVPWLWELIKPWLHMVTA